MKGVGAFIIMLALLVGSMILDLYSYHNMRTKVEDVQEYFETVHALVLQNQQYNTAILKRNEDAREYNKMLEPGEKALMEEVIQP